MHTPLVSKSNVFLSFRNYNGKMLLCISVLKQGYKLHYLLARNLLTIPSHLSHRSCDDELTSKKVLT